MFEEDKGNFGESRDPSKTISVYFHHEKYSIVFKEDKVRFGKSWDPSQMISR